MGEVAPGTSMAVDAISALILALDSKNSTTRSNVIKALGKFGKAAEAALGRLQAIQDSDKELASTARNAIDRIEGKAPPDAPRRKRGGGRRGSDAPARPLNPRIARSGLESRPVEAEPVAEGAAVGPDRPTSRTTSAFDPAPIAGRFRG